MNHVTLPTIDTSGVSTTRTLPTSHTGQRRYLLNHLEGDDYVMELDWTSMQAGLSCWRKIMWSLIYGRTEGRSAALLYGSAIHHALEQVYRGETHMDVVLSRGREEFADVPASLLEWRNEDKYVRTIEEYNKKWRVADSELFTVMRDGDNRPMVEQAFSLPLTKIEVNQFIPWPQALLVTPHVVGTTRTSVEDEDHRFFVKNIHIQWTGVVDVMLESQGQRWIMDHKTTSIGGDGFWAQFTLSQQLRGYVWAAQEIMHEPFEGGCVNALFGRKPSEKGKGKELELERKWIHYRPDQVAEWRIGMISYIEEFVTRLCTASFPENSVACVGKYGTCQYLDVCSLPEGQRLTLLASDQYSNNVWNPLV